MKVWTLHYRNSGTPEANKLEGVYSTPAKAWMSAYKELTKDYSMSHDKAIKEIGTMEDWIAGKYYENDNNYFYVEEHEIK